MNRLADKKIDSIEQAYRDLLEAIGENPERQGLMKTPARAARALEFLTQGYRQSVAEIVNDAVYDSDASEIILVKDIELYSMCEHHLLPFIGRAHVAYIPNGKVIGLHHRGFTANQETHACDKKNKAVRASFITSEK